MFDGDLPVDSQLRRVSNTGGRTERKHLLLYRILTRSVHIEEERRGRHSTDTLCNR
jgi:hypothetical protein